MPHTGAMSDGPLVDVVLLEVPLELRERAQEHSDELLREMTLIAMQISEGDGDALPLRLIRLSHEVESTYGLFSGVPNAAFDAASARGDAVLARVVYTVPKTIRSHIHHLLEIYEETDEFCRAGAYLLALASPTEIHHYRVWTLREFERQIDGLPPMPWPEYAARAS
jgi:hypothetical protein